MTTEPRLDDRLVHKLLLEADRALEAWPPENHPDAEASRCSRPAPWRGTSGPP